MADGGVIQRGLVESAGTLCKQICDQYLEIASEASSVQVACLGMKKVNKQNLKRKALLNVLLDLQDISLDEFKLYFTSNSERQIGGVYEEAVGEVLNCVREYGNTLVAMGIKPDIMVSAISEIIHCLNQVWTEREKKMAYEIKMDAIEKMVVKNVCEIYEETKKFGRTEKFLTGKGKSQFYKFLKEYTDSDLPILDDIKSLSVSEFNKFESHIFSVEVGSSVI